MTRLRTLRPARDAMWTAEQEQALEGIRACGFVPVEDAIASLTASVWGNTRSPLQVREARTALRSAGLPGTAIWMSWCRNVENMLYNAVCAEKLPIYGWPAQLDEAGFEIGPAPQDVTVIAPAIIMAVKPLHRGLPAKSLGLRPGMIARLASRGISEFPPSDCLVLFRLSEFLVWAKDERRKGRWPSQLNRGMKRSGLRGRSRTIIDRAIDLARRIVDDGRWTSNEPHSKLARIANKQLSLERKPPISEDTFGRALDELYRETGDKRFTRRVRKRHAHPH